MGKGKECDEKRDVGEKGNRAKEASSERKASYRSRKLVRTKICFVMNKLFFLECLRSILFLKFLKYCMAFVLSFYAGSYQSIYEANAASIPKSRRWKCVVPWATLLRERMKSEERQRERESLRKRERIRQKERKREKERNTLI